MLVFLIRRSAQTVPVLLIVTAMVFGMIWTFPGDPARAFDGAGEVLDEQQLAAIRREHRYDKPLPVQYVLWLAKTLRGDLGRSTQTTRRVTDELATRATVRLGLGLIAVIIEVPAGIVAALYRGRWADYVATFFSVGVVPIPDPLGPRVRPIIQGEVASPVNRPSGCHFHARCPKAMPQCSEVSPPLVDAQPVYWVACHLHPVMATLPQVEPPQPIPST